MRGSVGDATAEDPEPHVDYIDYDEYLKETDCNFIFYHLICFLLGDFGNRIVRYHSEDFGQPCQD
jgi:hypothetical protein